MPPMEDVPAWVAMRLHATAKSRDRPERLVDGWPGRGAMPAFVLGDTARPAGRGARAQHARNPGLPPMTDCELRPQRDKGVAPACFAPSLLRAELASRRA